MGHLVAGIRLRAPHQRVSLQTCIYHPIFYASALLAEGGGGGGGASCDLHLDLDGITARGSGLGVGTGIGFYI